MIVVEMFSVFCRHKHHFLQEEQHWIREHRLNLISEQINHKKSCTKRLWYLITNYEKCEYHRFSDQSCTKKYFLCINKILFFSDLEKHPMSFRWMRKTKANHRVFLSSKSILQCSTALLIHRVEYISTKYLLFHTRILTHSTNYLRMTINGYSMIYEFELINYTKA